MLRGLPTSPPLPYTTLFRSDLAAKGAAIAQADPAVAEARTAEPDVFYWLGFDIATGLFGDPALGAAGHTATGPGSTRDRKSTRLNSSHRCISYAVFCLKKKT